MLTENPGQLKSMVSSSTEIFLTKRIWRYIEMNGQLHCWNLAFEPIERKRLKILKSIMDCSNLCVVFDTPCVLKFLQEREKHLRPKPQKHSSLHTPGKAFFRPQVHWSQAAAGYVDPSSRSSFPESCSWLFWQNRISVSAPLQLLSQADRRRAIQTSPRLYQS